MMLEHIQKQLNERHRTRQEIMKEAINIRLMKSLQTYEEELSLGVEYVTQKSELNVLKKL